MVIRCSATQCTTNSRDGGPRRRTGRNGPRAAAPQRPAESVRPTTDPRRPPGAVGPARSATSVQQTALNIGCPRDAIDATGLPQHATKRCSATSSARPRTRRRGSRPLVEATGTAKQSSGRKPWKKEREQAASLLQTRQRGRIACREVEERREQTQAATSIGRIYRGKQTQAGPDRSRAPVS